MSPYEFITQYGIDYFTANKGKTITIRLLSDNGLVYSGYFVGITPAGNELPLVNGLVIELPQFNLHFLCKVPADERIVPVSVGLLLVDTMDDIKFTESQDL
jgi:hypothetical protein